MNAPHIPLDLTEHQQLNTFDADARRAFAAAYP